MPSYIALLLFCLFQVFWLDAPTPPALTQVAADSSFTFGNGSMTLTFDGKTGEWQGWRADPLPDNILHPDRAYPAVDVSVNGTYLIAQYGATPLRRETVSSGNQRQTLAITLGILPQNGTYAYELTSYYQLDSAQRRIQRWATLVRHKPGPNEHFDGFRFQVPGAALGNPSENTLSVPGPFFPKTFLAPNTPYDSLRGKHIGFHSAPDAGFGLLLLNNSIKKVALGSWMSTGGEVAYQTSIHGNERTVTLRHDDHRAYYLETDKSVESDQHWLELANSPDALMLTYRRMSAQTMPLDKMTPDWVKDQVILEMYPKYFKGGLPEMTSRLPFYKDVGFTMIYLMPHWQGGYSPVDPFTIDPAFGSATDLKNLVKTAHALGLKVIFDMVIHGFNEKSPVVQQRPELFVRNESGGLARHPTWQSVTTDWASSAYQQYMIDLVLHDQREYGIDGYRVDAATYKGAGWNPTVPYPAYRDGSAAPELLKKMLKALRQRNREAVFLSEVFGPVFYSVCNFGHDNQAEAVAVLLEKMKRGAYSAAEYKLHLTGVYTSLQPGANRVFYARNHDTSWFYHFNGYTPQFMAFETVHALFGVPEVFAGDPDYAFNPDETSTVYTHYKHLFTLRRQQPEWTRGSIRLKDVTCDHKQVFSGIRELTSKPSLALISFSEQVVKTTVTFDYAQPKPKAPILLRDIQTNEEVALTPSGANSYSVTLKPYQAVVGKLYRREKIE